MNLQLNESRLKADLIRKHGPTMGEVLFAHEAEKQKKRVEEYNRLLLAKEELEIEIAGAEATLPSMEPQERAMNDAHQVWLNACAEVESQRNRNVQAVSPLRARLSDLHTRIVTFFNHPEQGAWGLPGPEDQARHDADTWKPSADDINKALDHAKAVAAAKATRRKPFLLWGNDALV
jgi:hypothetical protein